MPIPEDRLAIVRLASRSAPYEFSFTAEMLDEFMAGGVDRFRFFRSPLLPQKIINTLRENK